MNDPLVVEQAGLWAKRLLAEGEATAEVRIGRLYEDALGRPPTTQETAAALEFIDAQGQELKLSSEAARRDPRVWADLAHVIWNVKEFVYIP